MSLRLASANDANHLGESNRGACFRGHAFKRKQPNLHKLGHCTSHQVSNGACWSKTDHTNRLALTKHTRYRGHSTHHSDIQVDVRASDTRHPMVVFGTPLCSNDKCTRKTDSSKRLSTSSDIRTLWTDSLLVHPRVDENATQKFYTETNFGTALVADWLHFTERIYQMLEAM